MNVFQNKYSSIFTFTHTYLYIHIYLCKYMYIYIHTQGGMERKGEKSKEIKIA